jgi:hypothetical protein
VSFIYLDENISAISLVRLTWLGDDVVEGRAVVGLGASDHVHLSAAAWLGRVFVTSNERDFLPVHHAWRDWFAEWSAPPVPVHGGLLLVGQPPIVAALTMADLVHTMLDSFRSGELIVNRIFLWDPRDGWRPDPPARR